MSETLKPCPFCGLPPYEDVQNVPHCPNEVAVWCTGCNVNGPRKVAEAEAIAAWNTRPTPGEDKPLGIEEVVERLRRYEALVVDYADMLEKADDIGSNVMGNDLREVAAALDPIADTILTLKAENDALREALRPFSEKAAYADALGAADDDYVDCAPFRAVEYRNARASTGEQP